MSHWATHYIGLPWEYGKEGPEAFDCWGFVRAVQRDHFGVEMPAVTAPESWAKANEMIQSHEERGNWQQVDDPREGDLVLMARNRHPVHIGVLVSANGKLGALHCQQSSGVVFSAIPQLRACGWGALTYYRRAA